MKITRSFHVVILVVTAIVLIFSCSKNTDKRKMVKEEYGEPDDIIYGGYGSYKSELYVYANKNINRAFEFNQSGSGCGGSGQWYIYRTYYAETLGYTLYLPPDIIHTPVQTANPDESVTITATITDDVEVISVYLYYRVKGQAEYLSVTMSAEKSIYTAVIPLEAVTDAGIEYYIEAHDDGHKTQSPEKGFYTIVVSEAGTSEKTTDSLSPVTTPRLVSPSIIPEPGKVYDDISPLSP